MPKIPPNPFDVAGAVYEETRLDALTQPTFRLRLMRRRLTRDRGFVSRARRQAIEVELTARGHQ